MTDIHVYPSGAVRCDAYLSAHSGLQLTLDLVRRSSGRRIDDVHRLPGGRCFPLVVDEVFVHSILLNVGVKASPSELLGHRLWSAA